jgi:hypothetical protein
MKEASLWFSPENEAVGDIEIERGDQAESVREGGKGLKSCWWDELRDKNLGARRDCWSILP